MTEKKCCGCDVGHPIEAMVLWRGLWFCFGCDEMQGKDEE